MSLKEDNKSASAASKKHLPFWKVLLLNLALIAVAIGLVVWLLSGFLHSYTHHDERIEVPDLTGVLSEDAVTYLESLGLHGEIVDSIYSELRPGAVVEQTPVAGLPVKKGRIIFLSVNHKAVRKVEMPDLVGWDKRVARRALKKRGFVIDSTRTVPYEFDSLVVSVNAAGGSALIPGHTYPIGTHVVVCEGSTQVAMVAENDSTESAWLE